MISRFSDWKDSRNGRGGTYYTLWSEDPAQEDASAAAIQIVFSADGSLYQRWQADQLAYSHRKVHQPGPLTRLLSSYEEASPFSGRPFQISPYSPHPLSRDDCAAYYKPAGLKAWLQDDPAAEDIVLVIRSRLRLHGAAYGFGEPRASYSPILAPHVSSPPPMVRREALPEP